MKKTVPGVSESDKSLLKELLPKESNFAVSQETIEKLIDLGNTIILEKDDSLIASGEKDSNLYILVDGLLRTWFWNDNKEETFAISTIPTVFFNYHTYFAGKDSFFQFEACIDSRVIKISKQDYDRLIAESHDFTRFMLGLANAQLYHYERKCRLSLGDSKEKYKKMIQDNPGRVNQMSLQTVASYLRITPQYLSKLRKGMK